MWRRGLERDGPWGPPRARGRTEAPLWLHCRHALAAMGCEHIRPARGHSGCEGSPPPHPGRHRLLYAACLALPAHPSLGPANQELHPVVKVVSRLPSPSLLL